jgi:hypothetical protein
MVNKLEIIEKFKPSQGQANELLAKVANALGMAPKTKIASDNSQADISKIGSLQDLQNLSDTERSNYQPTQEEQLEAGRNIDPVLNSLSQEQIAKGIDEGKNYGSKTLDNMIKQMANRQAAEKNPEMAKQIDAETGAAQPIDEKKQLFDELIKKEIKRLSGDDEKNISSAGDVVRAFQKGEGGDLGKGLNALSQYIGTSQGQGVLGSLMGALGNKDMQIAFARGSEEQLPIDIQREKDLQSRNQQKHKDIAALIEREMMTSSPKNGSGFKDVIDTYHDQGMIDDDKYQKLTQNPSYINNTMFPPSVIGKMMQPYLNTQGQQYKKEIIDYAQPGKEKIARIYGENAANLKGNVVAAKTPDELRKEKALADKAEKDLNKISEKMEQGKSSLARYSANLDRLNELMLKTPQVENIADQAVERAKLLKNPNRTSPSIAAFDAQKKHVALTGMKAIEDTTGRPSVFSMQQLLGTLPNWDDTPAVKKAKMNEFQNMVQTSADITYGGIPYKSPYGKSNPQNQTKTTAESKKISQGTIGTIKKYNGYNYKLGADNKWHLQK